MTATNTSAASATTVWQPVIVLEAPSTDEIGVSMAVRLTKIYPTEGEAMHAAMQAMTQREGATGFSARKAMS